MAVPSKEFGKTNDRQMIMPDGERVSHLQTIIGIVLCAVCVTLATPIVRIIAIIFGVMSGVGGFADWLPDAVAFYVIKLPTDLGVSVGTGFLAMLITARITRRADATIVAYVVGTIYLAIFVGLMAIIYSHGQMPDDLLSSSAQMMGIILGLAVGREHVLQR
jgi:hypothetical protein